MCAVASTVTWRDASGRALSDYARPSLAVDVALLTVDRTAGGGWQLSCLVHRRGEGFADGAWALPGTFVRDGERLVPAVRRAVQDKLGLRTRAPRQLEVFDAPDRDDRGHVVSVAHVDLLPGHDLPGSDPGRWAAAPVEGQRLVLPDGQARLPFDHDDIVRSALSWARSRYERSPDPSALLPEPFSLRELQLLHEAVLGRRQVKDTFRRHMERQLQATDERSSGVRGPRAVLYRRRD